MDYIGVGKEICPETKTPHLQGFVRFSNAKSMSAVSKIEGFKRAHLDRQRGTFKENLKYCSKGGRYFSAGEEQPSRGKRVDLEKLVELSKTSLPWHEIVEIEPAYMRLDRCFKTLKESYLQASRAKFRPVDVHVLYGATGTGKTRFVMELNRTVYKHDCNSKGSEWFDGYNDQEVLLLDDFYGGIKHSLLLNLLDGYQLRLPVKSSHTYSNWKTVYITSNEHPKTWYRMGGDEIDPPLRRRITTITKCLP